MKISSALKGVRNAFTLIELLVVIAIIGVLAAMILPAIAKAKTQAMETSCKMEMKSLVTAIHQYQSDYSRLPASKKAIDAAVASAATPTAGDFTYGTFDFNKNSLVSSAYPVVQTPGDYTECNAEVISILTADANYRNGTNQVFNPRKISYFQPKPAASTNAAGLGPDGVLRDPWGQPYIITLDLNYDEKCMDAYWVAPANPKDMRETNINSSVIIWSFGAPANKDKKLCSWK